MLDLYCFMVYQNLFHNQTYYLLSLFDVHCIRCLTQAPEKIFNTAGESEKRLLVKSGFIKALKLSPQRFLFLSQLRHPLAQLLQLKEIFLVGIQEFYNGFMGSGYLLGDCFFLLSGRIRMLNLLQPTLDFSMDQFRVF